MARTLPRQRRATTRRGLGRLSRRPIRAIARSDRETPETRGRPPNGCPTGRVQARPGVVDALTTMEWSDMTAGAAGAGGSMVGGAAAVLMIAIALNGPSAWQSASIDPAHQRPLLLRPEGVAHLRRHRRPHVAAAVQPTAATGPVALERPVRAFAASRHREPQARRHRRAA